MKRKFPQYLSSPLQVLFWDSDELCIIMMCFTIALLFGSVFWLLLIAGPWTYSHLKKKYPRGYLRHVLYFIGVIEIKNYPDYFQDVFSE